MAKFNLSSLKGSISSEEISSTSTSSKTPVTVQEQNLAKGIVMTVFFMMGLIDEAKVGKQQEALVTEEIFTTVQAVKKEQGKTSITALTKGVYKKIEKANFGKEGFPFTNSKTGLPAHRWDAVIHSNFRNAFADLEAIMTEPKMDALTIWKDHAKESRDKKNAAEG